MRLVLNRRRRESGSLQAAIDLPIHVGQPGFGREPASIFDLPDEFIVRRYVRWRLGSRQSEPSNWVREGIEVNAETAAVLLRSVGTTFCLVLAGILADWLATSERFPGGALLPAVAVGFLVAIGVPAVCLAAGRRTRKASGAGEQLVARRRWPGWLVAGDALATVAGGIAFGYASLSHAPSALPPRHLVPLAALVYTATGLAALGVWLLPVPVVPFLASVLRRMPHKIMLRMVDPGVAGILQVRLRRVVNGQRGLWRNGVLVQRSGALTWLGEDSTELDLTDSSVVTDREARPGTTGSRAGSRGPKVRVSGSVGEFELEMTRKLFRSYLAAASDDRGDMPQSR
jgi:hypothetical protein